jgi:hypothetical protein
MIPLSFQGASIRLSHNGGYFSRFQIANSAAWRSFEWNAKHFGALLSRERLLCGNMREETTQSGQSTVSSTDRCLGLLLKVQQESQNLGCGQVFQSQGDYGSLLMIRCEP